MVHLRLGNIGMLLAGIAALFVGLPAVDTFARASTLIAHALVLMPPGIKELGYYGLWSFLAAGGIVALMLIIRRQFSRAEKAAAAGCSSYVYTLGS